MEKSNASRSGIGHVFRVLRPLVWWLILVLVLYGIRTHERLLEQTRLNFSVSLQGWPIAATATLDGKPAMSGQKISLGSHMFSITYPKAEPFSTNLFIWYGPHNLGDIKLKRSMGTLHVQATPPASSITISGPEFSTNLYDSTGINLTVPTDQYTVRAVYRHWSQTQNSTVMANLTASCVFAPRLGAVHITCNKDEATYRLELANGQSVDSGSLPATVVGLPVGEYEMTALYHHRQIQKSVVVEAGATNEMPVEFILGAVRLETSPAGADVRMANGSYMGRTPLVVADLTPQATRFDMSLVGYEPVSVMLDIAADQTNSFSTNLVNIGYLSAMQNARNYMVASNFAAVVRATGAALNAKPNDSDALALQNEANEHLKAEQEQQDMLVRPKRVFDHLCADYHDAGPFRAYELKSDKPAKAVAASIVSALSSGLLAFHIQSDNSPEPKTYAVVAQQTVSLGVLGGSECDCLLVVGQASDHETQIWFKVLEFKIHHTEIVTGHLGIQDNKQLIPVNPPTSLQMVVARIRQGIDQASSAVQ